jgi:NADH-quinone oxidoreductase subunit N
VAQFGTIAIGLVAGGHEGVSAAIVAALAYGVAVMAAMGVIATQSGKLERHYLDDWAGVGRNSPLAGGVLALAVLSMAGIPPTIGFMGKFMLFLAAIGSGQYLLAVAGLISSLVSAAYCLKIVALLYMEPEGAWHARRMGVGETAVMLACLILLLLPGLLPGGLMGMAAEIAAQLLSR